MLSVSVMKDQNIDYRSPRLFVEQALAENSTLSLPDDSAHYLKNVLRRPNGAKIRVFNGRDGEFSASLLLDKKSASLLIEGNIRPQPLKNFETHLLFAPIKKDAQDFMIEKAVELGVTHFHPVLTQQTVMRDLNEKRVSRQIVEAAEQCERLDIPALAPLRKLDEILRSWPGEITLHAALERSGGAFIGAGGFAEKSALLIGPEGGFSEKEREAISGAAHIRTVSLGDNILRAETAALFGLSLMLAQRQKT